METIQLQDIKIFTKKKDGQLYIDKTGKKFARVSIKFQDKWASTLIYEDNLEKKEIIKTWKANDVVEIAISQSGDFLNFELPNLNSNEMTVQIEKAVEYEQKITPIFTNAEILDLKKKVDDLEKEVNLIKNANKELNQIDEDKKEECSNLIPDDHDKESDIKKIEDIRTSENYPTAENEGIAGDVPF